MAKGGWIKLFNKVKDWEWYSKPTTFNLFMHLLIEANHEAKMWHGVCVEAGQVLTSLASLSELTGLSVRQIRTALSDMKTTGELTIKTTNKYSLITLCKYVSYQGVRYTDRQADRQASGQINDNNIRIEEDNNNKKENSDKRKSFVKPTLQEVAEYCASRRNGIDPEQFVSYYESCGWMVGRNQMKDWRAAIRTWERNNRNYHTTTSPDNRRGTEVPTSPNYEQGL